MSIHSVSMKGHRPQNEDKHDTILNLTNNDKSKAPINYYAVYDGHGGKHVSKFLSKSLPQCFTDKRVTYPLKKTFVKHLYNHWQNVLKTEHTNEATDTGSTCSIVIHFKKDDRDYLNVLNTGDSRSVICRNNIAIALTKDHKPNWSEEKARITQLGGEPQFDGFDWRIKDLSVSRAFGDISAEPYITCMPDIFAYKLSHDDKFVILACDGLWDVLVNQDAVNFVLDNCYDPRTGSRINKHINVAKRLGELAIARGSTDNVTVLVIFFK